MPPFIDPDSAAASARRVRASDADRLATVERLQDAVARGLLTPDEGSERMADAFAAVFLVLVGALSGVALSDSGDGGGGDGGSHEGWYHHHWDHRWGDDDRDD